MENKIAIGGICKNCELEYPVGGPHLVLQHCVASLKNLLINVLNIQAQSDIKSNNFKVISRLCWLIVNKLHGGEVFIELKEIAEIPKAIGFEQSEAPGNTMCLRAITKPSAQ